MSNAIQTKIDALLAQYETHVGRGKMDNAGVTLKELVHSLVELVVTRTESYVEPVVEKAVEVIEDVVAHVAPSPAVLHEMPSENPALSPEPCAPCDVSIPNNPALIDEFKSTISVDIDAGTVTRGETVEPIIEHTTQEAPVVVEAAAEEPAAEVTSPEGDAAPAPKTPKKPKP